MNIFWKGRLAILLVFALFAVQTAETSLALDNATEHYESVQTTQTEDETAKINLKGIDKEATVTPYGLDGQSGEGFGAEDSAQANKAEGESPGGSGQLENESEPQAENGSEDQPADGQEEKDSVLDPAKPADSLEAAGDNAESDEEDIFLVLSDGVWVAADDEASLLAAVNSGQDEVEIHITSDVTLTDTLILSGNGKEKKIIIMADSENRVIIRNSGNNGLMIRVTDGAELVLGQSLQGGTLTLDFGTAENEPFNNRARLVNCEDRGTVIIENGVLTGLHSSYRDSAVVAVDSGGTVTMTGGFIEHNTFTNGYAAPVTITGGGSFELAGGSIVYNRSSFSNQESAGGVMLYGSNQGETAVFRMSGGQISYNQGYCAGVLLYGVNYWQDHEFYMTGGTISHNTANLNDANSTGGVFVYANAEFYMDGGVIEHNKASMGGGVAVYDGGNGAAYKDYYPARFVMESGTIRYNQAGDPDNVNAADTTDRGCGGGIYTASYYVYLNGGNIVGNTATQQGGGIYVGDTDYNVYLGPTVIKENKAVDQGRATSMSVGLRGSGGGMWFCHTGLIDAGAVNGIAVYDNAADVSGTDFYSVPKINPEFKYVTMPAEMLGGGGFNWIRDMCESVANHNPAAREPAEEHQLLCLIDHAETYGTVTEHTTTLSLKAEPSEEAKAAAEASATVFITGNTAPRGGGVGSNGNVCTGEKNRTDLKVQKLWEDEGGQEQRPDSLLVELKTSNGGHVLQEVELTAQSSWSHTFEALPDYGAGYYTVAEKELPQGYEGHTGNTVYNDETKAYEITITNTFQPPEPETDSGSVTLAKLAADSGDKLENATFELYKRNSEAQMPGMLLGDWTTDDSGTINITKLSFGSYYFVETEAPEGYEKDGTPIHFTVSKKEASVTLEIENIPTDNPGPSTDGGGGGSRNRPTGSVRLIKSASDGSTAIKDAVYELYNSNGGYLSTHTTNDSGVIAVMGLRYGDYYLVEVKAPAGYKLDGNPIHFTIGSSARVELQAVNHKTESPDEDEPPKTGEDVSDGSDENNEAPGDGNQPNGGSQDGSAGTAGSSSWDRSPKTGLSDIVPLLAVSLMTVFGALLLTRGKRKEKQQ